MDAYKSNTARAFILKHKYKSLKYIIIPTRMEQIQKSQSAPERVYKDLQPYFDWTEDEASSTLILMLPGMVNHSICYLRLV